MRFSIVIPIYNVECYIRECVESVLYQDFQNFEIICINDGSTDNSATIAEKLISSSACNYRIINQPNQGLSAARNAGIRAANGDYILFLDSDDCIEKNTLSELANCISGEDMICFSGRRYFESDKTFEDADFLPAKEYNCGWDYYCENALLKRNFAFVCVVLRLYRRQFLLENNLFFEEGITHEDNLFTPLACYYAQKVKVISDCFYNYRIRKGSIMTTKSLQNCKDLLSGANKLATFFADKVNIDRTVVYRVITHQYQNCFSNCRKGNDKNLLPLMDWKSYHSVSRTKLRHKVQFTAMRINPALFRIINKI